MIPAFDEASFDPFASEVLASPYEYLARIREATPAFHVRKHGFFLVGRYEDVVHASRQHGIFSSTGGVGLEWKPRPMMPMYDPPAHTRLRRLVSSPFTPRSLARLAPVLEQTVDELLDAALQRGTIDVVHDLAEPLSLMAIAQLLGVPPELREDFRRWADNTMLDLAGGVDAETAARLEASRVEFVGFLRKAVEDRRAQPGGDLISKLVSAEEEDALSSKEVVAFCVLLLVAGFEPTINAIANASHTLVERPADQRALSRTPEGIASTVEECLRFDSPVQCFFRNTLVDTRIGDVDIPAKTKVMIHFASANRDSRKFPDADVFRWDRHDNDHIAFGAGVHFCLGAALARMQMNILFERLFQRVALVEPAGKVARADNLLFRCIKSLPVELRGA